MSSTAISMGSTAVTLTLDQWQIVFHEAMAAILRATEAARRQVGLLGIINSLWKSNRDLKHLNLSLKAISELPDGVLSRVFIESQIPQLRHLLESINHLLDIATDRGWMNRSITSAPCTAIRLRGIYIFDYLEALEMSIDPEVLKAIEDGRAEIERGDCESVRQLF